MIIVNANLPLKEEKKDCIIKQAKTLISYSMKTYPQQYQDAIDESLIFLENGKARISKIRMQT